MAKKKKIVAILRKKYLRTHWGFVFNTEIQSFVEQFMLDIHVTATDYWLSYEHDAPEGVYTDVNVNAKYNEDGSVKKVSFRIS
jgi:hypothetical protein